MLLALLACAVIATGCGSPGEGVATAADAPPQHGGQVTVGLAKEPPIINPWLAQGAMVITNMLVDGLNDPLVTMDSEDRWQPVLATTVPTLANGGVQLVGDGMVIRFSLRPEAHWSDGTPITCEDVRFTWQTVMDPGNQISNRLGWDQVEGIDCPQPKQVVIRMVAPYALYLSRIMAWGPLPAHALRGKDFNTYWNNEITVSSGPYVFDEWQRGVKFVVRRNDDYWNAGPHDLPYLDRIVYRFVRDANTLKMQLRMNEVDVTVIPADTNLVSELESIDGIEFDSRPGAVLEHLILQTATPPLDDVRVRRALAHLIDRDMIASVVLRGQVPALQSSIVPTQPAFAFDSFARYATDEERAAQLLEQAGYTREGDWWTRDGQPLTLTFVAGAGSMPFRASVAQLVQQQLARAGIRMEIEMVAPEVLYSDVAPRGAFNVGEWSEPAFAEPAPSIQFACSQVPQKPQWAGKNRYRYCNPEVDALLARADREVDQARRVELLRQIDDLLAQDVPLLPLFASPDTTAWAWYARNVRPNTNSTVTWNVGEWWVVPR